MVPQINSTNYKKIHQIPQNPLLLSRNSAQLFQSIQDQFSIMKQLQKQNLEFNKLNHDYFQSVTKLKLELFQMKDNQFSSLIESKYEKQIE